MGTISRRTWLKTASALATMAASQEARANDRVVMGIMGIKDRGWDLALEFGMRDDTEIRYLVLQRYFAW